jgi:rhodanese-related sulfurtransferase
MMDAGTDMVILDSRPLDEFRRMSIPGAIDVPGGELVYRIGANPLHARVWHGQ